MDHQNQFILCLAPTGMIPSHSMTPHVPLTPEMLAKDIEECKSLGVTQVHIHARDNDGQPTNDRDTYAHFISAVREVDEDIIICVSCSGRFNPDYDDRSSVLFLEGDLKPDMASLTPGSINFAQSASINTPEVIKQLALTMIDRGIKPEIEVFDLGMVNYANYLIRKKILQPPCFFNVILGNIASAQTDAMQLGTLLNSLPDNSYWCGGGLGNSQLFSNTLALTQGGGVRVGIEDNIWFDQERTQLATNLQMVQRIIDLAAVFEYSPMNPGTFRQKLELKC